MASTLAMPIRVAPAKAVRARTLKEQLAEMGIPTLPREAVATHKRRVQKEAIDTVRRERRIRHLAMAAIFISVMVGLASVFFQGASPWTMPLVGVLLTVFFLLRRGEASARARGVKVWEKVHYEFFADVVPQEVVARGEAALTIPGTDLYVDRFGGDPFLIVRLGKQEHYIAAWNTGTDLDLI